MLERWPGVWVAIKRTRINGNESKRTVHDMMTRTHRGSLVGGRTAAAALLLVAGVLVLVRVLVLA
jgi:hypothetical protein